MPVEMSADELREHLVSGDELPSRLSLVGFVEAGDEGYLSFSLGTSCKRWTTLPLSLVHSALPLGSRQCRDHRHNLVRIEFKTSDNPEVRPLLALLQELSSDQSNRPLNQISALRGMATERLAQVVCDSIGDIVICTDGTDVCWYSPRTGFHCN